MSDPLSSTHQMGRTSRLPVARGLGGAFGPAFLALLPVFTYGIFVLANWNKDPMLGGDQGLLELWTRSASDGEAFLGPYSRFLWNHPGPTVFYWFTPFYFATGQRPGGLGIACLIVVILGMAYVCRISEVLLGRVAAWATALAILAFLVATGTDWFDETWNPVLIVVPVIVLGSSAAAVLAGRRSCLPVVVGAATFALQTHVGTLPVVGALAVMMGVAGVSSRNH